MPTLAPPSRPPSEPPPGAPEHANDEQLPRWAPWTAPLALLSGFVIALFGALVIEVAAAVGGGTNLSQHQPAGVLIGATYVQDVALVGSAVLFASMAGRPRPWQFGLRPTRLWPAAGWTLLAGMVFLLVNLVWSVALQPRQKDDLLGQLHARSSTAALVATAILVSVLAPIAEELFFRGYFFTALRRWKGTALAVLLTGLVFGAIHLGSAPAVFVPPLMFFGALLCVVYVRTGSLYPCIALHSLNNALAFGVMEHWSWQVPALMAGALACIAAIVGPVGARGRPAVPVARGRP